MIAIFRNGERVEVVEWWTVRTIDDAKLYVSLDVGMAIANREMDAGRSPLFAPPSPFPDNEPWPFVEREDGWHLDFYEFHYQIVEIEGTPQ